MLIKSPLNRYTQDNLPSEQYKWLKNTWHLDRFCITIPEFLENVDTIPEHIASLLRIDKDCQTWVKWVNLNIILNLGDNDYMTTNVLLRIATGMLFNLKQLTQSEKQFIHCVFTANVQHEMGVIMIESLPF